MFDVYYIGRNEKIKSKVPFAKQIEDTTEISPRTKMYWLIEPNVEILDIDVLKYRPPEYDQIFEHVWKWDQNNYGGVKLVPSANMQGTKQLNHIVCKKNFDVLTSNTPGHYFRKNPYATHVWCVDSEYNITDELTWAPDMFEPDYIHSFHLRGQLEHKYPDKEGGVKLYPRNWKNCGTKFHGFLDNVISFPFMYVDDPNDYSQRDIYDDDFVWLIDRQYKINEETLDWSPGPFDNVYVHNFRMTNQLKNKYPMQMGGIFLVPKNWKECDLKIHKSCPVEDENYDVFYTNKKFTADTFEYYAKRSLTDWFWVVDWDYEFNGKLLFVPEEHEQEYIHVFKWGLDYRYDPSVTDLHDNRVAGIYLVNKNFDYTLQKLHVDKCPITYDIFYTEDVNNFLLPSRKSRTDMFWLVDQDYILSNEFTYVPSAHDQNYIHIFKIQGQLEHKYDPDVTNVSDNRAGGVKLVPRDSWEDAEKKFVAQDPLAHTNIRMFYSDDPSDFSSMPEGVAVWMVDNIYELPGELSWVPAQSEQNKIHVFHSDISVKEGSKDKYVAGKNGGIVYYPAISNEDRATAEVVIHNESPIAVTTTQFEVYSDLKQGLENSQTDWFWLIDPNVDMLNDFSFSFIPDSWDKDKIHVWQKQNPITGRQYDYDGVKLVPKTLDPEVKSRPKYIKEVACIQRQFGQLYLDPEVNILRQLKEYDKETSNSHFWVIDPHVEIAPDFEFDYYPTQWDAQNVHVFQDQNGNYRNVRLYPKGFFEQYPDLTEEQIDNNSFENVKLMNTVVSQAISWPVITLNNMSKDQFVDKLKEYHLMGYAYAWSIDSDVIPDNAILSQSYQPNVTAVDKIHLWQRINPMTDKVHSYGGLRLWPTSRDYSTMTTKAWRLNKLKGIQYVREVGSKYKPFDIVFISYKDEYADQKYRTLKKKYPKLKWVNDVDGIFEAHKAAAEKAKSPMFWVVDSDAELVEDFEFSYIPDVYDQETTHVWKTINPITDDSYGYGGVKLFNRQQILDATSWGLDFTTGLSSSFKVVEEVSNVSRFNDSALNTWRSAFREAAKLQLKEDTESADRLDKWLNPANTNALYWEYAQAGAEAGKQYAENYFNKPLRMSRINDFAWLENQFNNYEKSKDK